MEVGKSFTEESHPARDKIYKFILLLETYEFLLRNIYLFLNFGIISITGMHTWGFIYIFNFRSGRFICRSRILRKEQVENAVTQIGFSGSQNLSFLPCRPVSFLPGMPPKISKGRKGKSCDYCDFGDIFYSPK